MHPSFSSSTSGVYRPRPSIARYIEASLSGVFTSATQVMVRLDVLSDHQLYLGDDGQLAGVFVVTATPSRVGSPVNLDIKLPWGESLEIAGTVEWVREVPRVSLRHRPGMGVKFELLPQQLALLERALLLREPIRIPGDAAYR